MITFLDGAFYKIAFACKLLINNDNMVEAASKSLNQSLVQNAALNKAKISELKPDIKIRRNQISQLFDELSNWTEILKDTSLDVDLPEPQ